MCCFAARKEIFYEFFNGNLLISRRMGVRSSNFLKFVQNFFGLLKVQKIVF